MKKILAMLLAVLCLCGAAFAERYESTLGYSLDLPEDWRPLTEQTYPEIEAAVGADKMAEIGFTAETAESMVLKLRDSGIEYCLRFDGEGAATIVAQPGASSMEILQLSAEVMRQGLEDAGIAGAVVGEAVFGENTFVALVYEADGVVAASYFTNAGDKTYTITFSDVPADVLGPILASAVIAGPEPAKTVEPGGALLPRRG